MRCYQKQGRVVTEKTRTILKILAKRKFSSMLLGGTQWGWGLNATSFTLRLRKEANRRVFRMVFRLVSEGGLSGLLTRKSWINDSDGL